MSAVATASHDADLVQQSLVHGTPAFSQIVTRYQTLICSLTYSATGSVSRSEDLAQEVFVTAWKELRHLREPEKLRSWLCGIARRIIANTVRREGREPVCAAEELADEHHAPNARPDEQAISREEEVILWRSLEKIPETYREPLVLFYREGRSVESVAEALGLTEDATKQRLSRGRKLLQEQVAAFVEGALRMSTPGRAFTLGVIAALPLMKTSAAAATTLGSVAAKTGGAAKGLGLLGVLGMLLGPIAGVITVWMGLRAGYEYAQSDRERRFLRRQAPVALGLVFFLALGIIEVEPRTASIWESHPLGAMLFRMGWFLAFLSIAVVMVRRMTRKHLQIHAEEASKLSPAEAERHARAWRPLEYRSRLAFLGLPLLHVYVGRAEDGTTRTAFGWIAIGDRAVGVLFALGITAVGGVSLGVLSFGILPLGIISAGALAFGSIFSVGVWGAMGATAVGYMAHGGNALAWHAAMGSRAVAHTFAEGLHTFAQHANDAAARAAIDSQAFFRLSRYLAHHSGWTSLMWLPFILIPWQAWRARRALQRK
ncbi:MAG TPA: sigma-70 family RNA polymerase sigma factor [Chthoniobacter sp.]